MRSHFGLAPTNPSLRTLRHFTTATESRTFASNFFPCAQFGYPEKGRRYDIRIAVKWMPSSFPYICCLPNSRRGRWQTPTDNKVEYFMFSVAAKAATVERKYAHNTLYLSLKGLSIELQISLFKIFMHAWAGRMSYVYECAMHTAADITYYFHVRHRADRVPFVHVFYRPSQRRTAQHSTAPREKKKQQKQIKMPKMSRISGASFLMGQVNVIYIWV